MYLWSRYDMWAVNCNTVKVRNIINHSYNDNDDECHRCIIMTTWEILGRSVGWDDQHCSMRCQSSSDIRVAKSGSRCGRWPMWTSSVTAASFKSWNGRLPVYIYQQVSYTLPRIRKSLPPIKSSRKHRRRSPLSCGSQTAGVMQYWTTLGPSNVGNHVQSTRIWRLFGSPQSLQYVHGHHRRSRR